MTVGQGVQSAAVGGGPAAAAAAVRLGPVSSCHSHEQLGKVVTSDRLQLAVSCKVLQLKKQPFEVVDGLPTAAAVRAGRATYAVRVVSEVARHLLHK